MKIPLWRLIFHDMDKFRPFEFIPYALCFVGKYGEEIFEPSTKSDLAWLYHQKQNDHHWQYWVLYGDNGEEKAIEMSFEAVHELVADYIAMGKTIGVDASDYFIKNRDGMKLHPFTRHFIEELMVAYAGMNRRDISELPVVVRNN